MGYLYVAATLLLTVYGQLVFKWQIDLAGGIPDNFSSQIRYFLVLLFNPWVISSFVAAFIASLTWIGSLNHFELSYAYPFMSLSFVLVLIFSVILFGDSVSIQKIIGITFLMVGVTISSQG